MHLKHQQPRQKSHSVYRATHCQSPNDVYQKFIERHCNARAPTRYNRRNESVLNHDGKRAFDDCAQGKKRSLIQQLNPFNRKLKKSSKHTRGRSQNARLVRSRTRGRSFPAGRRSGRSGTVCKRDSRAPQKPERRRQDAQVSLRTRDTTPAQQTTCYCCHCLGLTEVQPEHCKKFRGSPQGGALLRPVTMPMNRNSSGRFDKFRDDDWRSPRSFVSPRDSQARQYGCNHSQVPTRAYSRNACDVDFGQSTRDYERSRYGTDLSRRQSPVKYTGGTWNSRKFVVDDWRPRRQTACVSDMSEMSEDEKPFARRTIAPRRPVDQRGSSRREYDSSLSESEDSMCNIDIKINLSEAKNSKNAHTNEENVPDNGEKGKNRKENKATVDEQKIKDKNGNAKRESAIEIKNERQNDSVRKMKAEMDEHIPPEDNESNEINCVFLGSQSILNEVPHSLDENEENKNAETLDENGPVSVIRKAEEPKAKAIVSAKNSNEKNPTKSSNLKSQTKNLSEKSHTKNANEESQKKSPEAKNEKKNSNKINQTGKSDEKIDAKNKPKRTILRVVKTNCEPCSVRLETSSRNEQARNKRANPAGRKRKSVKNCKCNVEISNDLSPENQMADLIYLMKDCKEKNKLLNLKIAARPVSLED